MNSKGIGQYIRSWGPKVHEHKSGTPTMGGLAILGGMAATLVYLWFSPMVVRANLILFAVGTFGFGAIGLVDDLLSLIRGKAEGLSPGGKIATQVVTALIFLVLVFRFLEQPTLLSLPFSSTKLTLSPIFFWPLAVFVMVGTVNAVNLTDGMDGLAAGASLITITTFCLIGSGTCAPYIAGMVAAIIGFLWYNSYPAEIFMGDTGAFALGGFIATAAIVARGEVYLPLLGGLFVLESLSIMIQVGYYKTTGERVFKISPLHHHFESAEGIDYEYLLPKVEWSEPKVAARLLTVHLVLAGIGLLGYFIGLN